MGRAERESRLQIRLSKRQNMRRMLCSVVLGATGGPETDLRRTLDAAWAVRDACDAG